MKFQLKKNESISLSVGCEVIPKGVATERNNYWKVSYLDANNKTKSTRIAEQDFDVLIDMLNIKDDKILSEIKNPSTQQSNTSEVVYPARQIKHMLEQSKLRFVINNEPEEKANSAVCYSGKSLMDMLKKSKLHIKLTNDKKGFVYKVMDKEDDVKFITTQFSEIWDVLNYDLKVQKLDEPFAYNQNF